jgi:PAS domain S-box-containing protein
MKPNKLADAINDLKRLFRSPSYDFEEIRFFEQDLQQINLHRVRILSLLLVAINLLSLFACFYYCYNFGNGNFLASALLMIFHMGTGIGFLRIYLVLQKINEGKTNKTPKGRHMVWLFSMLFYSVLIHIAVVDVYAAIAPSLSIMMFCITLIAFYRNPKDLIYTYFIGLFLNFAIFILVMEEGHFFSGYLFNLCTFSIIFLFISRSMYHNKIDELLRTNQLKDQRDQLNIQNILLIDIESTLSSIHRNIQQGLFRLDQKGNLIYANDFLVGLFGYQSSIQMMQDWNLKKILTKKDLLLLTAAIKKEGFIKDKEIKHIKDNGSIFWGLINCSATSIGDTVFYEGIIIDNTLRKENEKVLENLSLVASKTDNAVFIIDKEEKIEWVNESFIRITGYSFEEAVGKKPGILFQGENTDPTTIMQIGEKINRGEGFSGELLNYRKDGSEFWVHFTLNPILNESKEIIKYVAVESDITERKNVEKELIKAKEEAETSMKAKEQFLSMVSHELRTPLNAVIGMTHLLLQEDPRNDQLQNLKTIKTSGEYLLALINDILDFSKIEAGKISISQTNFSFRELIHNLEQTFYYHAQEKNIRLFIDICPRVPNALIGDPVRLNQILVNLIGNSIKFTDVGHVKLTVRCEELDTQRCNLKFQVTDTGIGIPAEKLNLIFERFEQVNDKAKRGGTGLGLAITKSLIELMGGTIKAESELGIGSEFSFDVCLEKGEEKQLENVKSSSYNIIDDLSNIKILLVEDNKINQLVAAKFLKQWKIDFDIADNGQKAVALSAEHDYDLILMDLQMPVMDGIAATREIRKLPGYHFVPIVALTAASLETKDDAYQVGMNDFLIKPFNPVELYNKIKKIANSDFKPSSKLGIDNIEELDISGIQKISDGDSRFLLVLLNMCVEQFRNLPHHLNCALKENNIREAKNLIHKISPSIKMMQCYELEKITLEFSQLLKENGNRGEIQQKSDEIIAIVSKMERLLIDKATELNNKLMVNEQV